VAETDFEIIDSQFRHCVRTSACLEQLWSGGRWTEGPAYFPALRSLIWSDIPNDRIMRWDETTGAVGTLSSGRGRYVNGSSVDRQGRLVSCEHGGRRVVRVEHDGALTVLADGYEGKRLNSPNDVVVASDGAIWFTDPTYGIDTDYEGFKSEREIDGCHVYRIDPVTGVPSIVADDFVRPNGLAFSPDESRLYIVDSGASHQPDGPRHVRMFDVGEGGALSGGGVFAECTNAAFDGLRLDDAGRLWLSAGDGVHCYTPEGELIGKVLVPERVSNLCFGGAKRNHLFMTATTSVYAMLLPVNGVKTF